MEQQATKPRNVTIACEACRRHKIRCNGAHPCGRRDCQDTPRVCVYRRRARTRRRRGGASAEEPGRPPHAAGSGDAVSDEDDDDNLDERLPAASGYGPPASSAAAAPSPLREREEQRQPRQEEQAYQSSITATHHAPRPTDSSQLFYGPSSNFAFLQELRRGVLAMPTAGGGGGAPPAGFDALLQRSIFFGIPQHLDPDTIWATEAAQPAVPVPLAREFLAVFKATSLHRLPFYTAVELDELFDALAGDVAMPASLSMTTTPMAASAPASALTVPPQARATFLAVLAIGALGTAHTEEAEALFVRAKRAAVVLDEVVSLQMIWFAILLADYQINLGRPNAAYLHIGTACRKAFSFGLHKEAAAAVVARGSSSAHCRRDDVVRKHRVTLWILYYYETFQSLSMGRNTSMRMCDISCPRPTEPPSVVRLCELAHIMEATSDTLYRRTTDSLRHVYRCAEDLHRRLRRFANAHDIGSAYVDTDVCSADNADEKVSESLTLHTSYYLAVILIFRPFLVSSYAIQSGTRRGAHDDMWLHQACRHAVNAAQDSIRFTSDAMQKVKACRKIRFQCFFLESTCGVLLYDMLREPATCAYSMGFVRMALIALGSMVADEPVITAVQTLRQVSRAVEKAVAVAAVDPALMSGRVENSYRQQLQLEGPQGESLPLPVDQQHCYRAGLATPTATAPGSEHMVYLHDRSLESTVTSPQATGNGDGGSDPFEYPMAPHNALGPSPLDFSTGPNFDVLTTDLFNFFPSGYAGSRWRGDFLRE